MIQCEFERMTSGPSSLWRCVACGFVTHKPMQKAPIRTCGTKSLGSPQHEQSYLTCPYRGTVLSTVSARAAGCGCASTQVDIFRCQRFNEPVLKQAADRCLEKIREAVPMYSGRTCRGCPVPKQAADHGREPETLRKFTPAPQSIGVVVTCHNYGRYLRQCLDSILAQTERPAVVVLVDDASSDDTPAIGLDYETRGVLYLRGEWRDVSEARNAGVELCGKPAYYCFVDADDWLPTDYLAKLRGAMTDNRIGVTYPQCLRFNDQGEIGLSPWIIPFDWHALHSSNFACATSLVRRQAFEQVGGWRSYRYGLHDWDLWLRITRAGWRLVYVPDVALRYRIHGNSMSDARHGNYDCGAEVMSRSQLTAVVTLFSGRGWMLDRWFANLAAVEWTRENLHLVAVDNSRSPEFATKLRRRLESLESVGIRHTYLRDDSRIVEDASAEQVGASRELRTRNVYAMGQHLARLYALAGQYLPAQSGHVWSVEDDVGVEPGDLRRLATELFRLQGAAVSGCLRSRFGAGAVAWAGGRAVQRPPEKPIRLDATGFYCLLARRKAWDLIAWRPGDTMTTEYPYYDWAASADITRHAGPIYLTGDVRCGHWQGPDECLRFD